MTGDEVFANRRKSLTLPSDECRRAWVNAIAGSPWLNHRIRLRLLRRAGMRIGYAHIDPGCCFIGSLDVTMGQDCYVNARCVFDAGAPIVIEDGVNLGNDVRLITSGHDIGPAGRRCGTPRFLPIRVGRGSWLGAGVTILPGIEIAPGCIVAAGAVVTRSTDPNGLYAGIPARRIRDLS
jgi:maltose O-acetyltransferase